MTVESVTVLGAGTMGVGIAQVALLAGYKVKRLDLKEELVDKGVKNITNNIEKLVEKEKVTAQHADMTLARLSKHVSLSALSDVDMVFEVIIENMSIKKTIQAAR